MKLFGGQKFTFRDYLHGPQNSDDEIIDGYGHGLINNAIGLIVIVVLLFLTVKYFA